MTDPVTLRLPESLLQQARELAAVTNQSLEAVLIDWLEFAHQHQPGADGLAAGTELAEPQAGGDRRNSPPSAQETAGAEPPHDPAAD